MRQVIGPVFTDGGNTDVVEPGTTPPLYSDPFGFAFDAEIKENFDIRIFVSKRERVKNNILFYSQSANCIRADRGHFQRINPFFRNRRLMSNTAGQMQRKVIEDYGYSVCFFVSDAASEESSTTVFY